MLIRSNSETKEAAQCSNTGKAAHPSYADEVAQPGNASATLLNPNATSWVGSTGNSPFPPDERGSFSYSIGQSGR